LGTEQIRRAEASALIEQKIAQGIFAADVDVEMAKSIYCTV
jgi:hypothetical protein